MIIDFNKQNGGGGSGSGVTPEQVQAQIDSALTYYWESGETLDFVHGEFTDCFERASDYTDEMYERASGYTDEMYGRASGYTDEMYEMATGYTNDAESRVMHELGNVRQDAFDYTDNAVSGKADAKILVDFDKTPQSERASIYAELKALYDGGSGATINKLYDFYKTVNTWQGQKIDYYTFSGNTLVFGQVVSPENVTDQVVYVQVMEIDSAGNVNVVTNAIGASGGGVSQEYVDSAVTILQDQLDTIDDVIPAAIVDLNDRVDELSGSTPDLSAFWNSAQTQDAISAATAGKADALNINPNTGGKFSFPRWNSQGIITGEADGRAYQNTITINGASKTFWGRGDGNPTPFYAPQSAGTAGEILVSTGNGAPVWSAVTMGGVSQEYVDSAITQVQDQLDIIDQVASAALVDLNEKKVESEDVKHMVKLTQAAYDQLSVKDPETFYIIVNNN